MDRVLLQQCPPSMPFRTNFRTATNKTFLQSIESHRSSTRHRCQRNSVTALNAAPAESSAAPIERLTPHSGYHYDGRSGRFFEGWYFSVTLPGDNESFAWMYSIENPSGSGKHPGVGAQVMGPNDGYLVQFDPDVQKFWGDKKSLALGACFKAAGSRSPPRVPVTEAQFDAAVAEGFQASLTGTQGSLRRQEERVPGDLPSTAKTCRWSMSVKPVYGWGPPAGEQQSTAGWLAALPVFEPHWQIMMARGLASGWVEWDGERYEFQDAPSYWEKNWGGGFPDKWFWVQCNRWDGDAEVALTAVGAKRGVANLPGVKEDVGLIGVHFGSQFIELVPWQGTVSWDVAPWGRWSIRGRSDRYEAEVEATCDNDGTPLRAPTAEEGLAPRCRDSFCGRVRLQVWELDGQGGRILPAALDVTSSTGAVEIGGGPWEEVWRTTARMTEPLKSLVKLPLDVDGIASVLPPGLRPPGL